MKDVTLSIEDARIIFKNFSGQVSQFNPQGKRDFCVLLDPDQAERLKADGWHVKYLQGRVEGDEPQAYMKVKVSFDNYPPKIMLVTKGNATQLTSEDVQLLDWSELEHVDLVIRPYNWDVNGNQGRTAYLKAGYFKIEEDEFAEKYANLPSDSDSRPTAL